MRHNEPEPRRGRVEEPRRGGDQLVPVTSATSHCVKDWRAEAKEQRRQGQNHGGDEDRATKEGSPGQAVGTFIVILFVFFLCFYSIHV